MPASEDPKGFRHNASIFRAYSSSIAARPVSLVCRHRLDLLLRLTTVERFELIACNFRVVHALKKWLNPGILFAPEIVRD